MMPPRAAKPRPWISNETLDLVLKFIIALAVVALPPYFAMRASHATAVVADKLETSTAATKEKLDNIASVGEETRTWVNHLRGVLLKDNAETKRRMANLTKDEADATAAELAENLYREHEKAQEAVNALPGSNDKQE